MAAICCRTRNFHCLVGTPEYCSSLVVKDPTRIGETHRFRTTLQQRESQLVLEIPNLPTQSGLRYVQAEGGARNILLLGHSRKIPKMAQFHSRASIPARHAQTRNMVFPDEDRTMPQ